VTAVVPPDFAVLVTGSGEPRALEATLGSLALQTGVSWHRLVLGDPARELADARRAIEEGPAPLITFVRAGDVLLPGALEAIRAAMEETPPAGLADGFWLPLDGAGRITRHAARTHVARLRWRSPVAGDRRACPTPGTLGLTLPTFRRDTLLRCGGLSGPTLEMAVAAAVRSAVSRSDARLVPEVLCATARLGRHGDRRRWWVRLADRQTRWQEQVRGLARRLMSAVRRTPWSRALLRAPSPYATLVGLLQWCDLAAPRPRRSAPRDGGPRIAYVLWRYPLGFDTFIRREVTALQAAGLDLQVFALGPDQRPDGWDGSGPVGGVTYFGPENTRRGRAAIWRMMWRRPWTVVRLWLLVVGHRYRQDKRWWQDRDVLYLAGQLAEALGEHGITHVHSPWANHYAFLALLAARLLGVSCSVQARASEIHRSVPSRVVRDRLRFAEFVVTNSQYNARHLHRELGAAGPPIHVVYNGVDLSQLRPVRDAERPPGPFRILAVGRLVEPKGFRYLLQACRRLRDRRLDFACDIIGGPEPADSRTWVDLRMLHTELGLEAVVRFHGEQPFTAVVAACQRADLFVLPCVRGQDGSHDITPNSLIEAMAMGLPVVSCSSGAIPEIVDDERNGLLVPPNDERALAEAIERLRADAVLRRRLGQAARDTIAERFDITRNVTQRLTLFHSLSAE
jgi:glycosyltransferase involved in cell wall biosynthesis